MNEIIKVENNKAIFSRNDETIIIEDKEFEVKERLEKQLAFQGKLLNHLMYNHH